ncbi:MAG: cell division protein FtsQ/DivIB [Nitrosomonas sp.]|nr:cell division protein FtsQ/DivIB [Nitrosomonas sp.]MCW5617910.1 cell division protein FtsQ/DivIB [Nitrosomonas sp.]
MWDNHRLLNFVSNLLFILTAVAVIHKFSQHFDFSKFIKIREIHVQSMYAERVELKYITRAQIERVVNNDVYGNFLSVDLIAVRDAFMKIPWVRDAKVERIWPLGLNVKLEEHQVIAHWGSHALVNTYGEVFRAVLDEKFPVFTGPMEANSGEVIEKYHLFSQILAPLQQSIAKINLSSRHAWRIQLEAGTILELGRVEMEERLRRYVSVYNHSIAHLNQGVPLAYVDLRYPNGFAVNVSDAQKPSKNKNGTKKET